LSRALTGSGWLRAAVGWALLALLTAFASVAHAGSRHAIVIGSNLGDAGEEQLQYAESDAVRFAEVMTKLGGVAHEDLILLTATDASSVQSAIASLRYRIAAAPESDSVLFIYYSGHADSNALHLRGTRLPFTTLRELARTAGAEMTVFVVDACRSGGITRVKGGRPTVPFDLGGEDHLVAEGIAIMTSSAASEDAQESDRLRGGIFTHHLVNGLAGAADASRDDLVTLSEAYRYAYSQTLRATVDAPVLQHPTFELALRGRQELVLTRLDAASGYARVVFDVPGHYLVFGRFGSERGVAAELDAIAGTELLLAPGTYLVQRRTLDGVGERSLTLALGEEQRIGSHDLSPLPFRETVRRGIALPEVVFSGGLGFELSGPVMANLGPSWLGYVSGQWDMRNLAVQLRFRAGGGTHDNAGLAITTVLVGIDLTALHAFDLTHGLALGLGLRVGADWLHQTFTTTGDAPARDQLVARVAPLGRIEWALFENGSLGLDIGADIYALQSATHGGIAATVAPFVGLGFSVRW